MARATAAGMLVLFGGVHPPGHDATSFAAFVPHADAIVDVEALPAVISTTGTNEVLIGDIVGYNLVIHSMWGRAGGDLTGKPEPVVLTNTLKHMIKQLAMDTTEDSFHALDMIDEDA